MANKTTKASLEGEVERLKVTLTEAEDELNQVKGAASELETKNTKLINELATANSAVESTSAVVTELQLQIARLDAELQSQRDELDTCRGQWDEERRVLETTSELERFRALHAERSKWEEREARLVDEVKGLKGQIDKMSMKSESVIDSIRHDYENKLSELKSQLSESAGREDKPEAATLEGSEYHPLASLSGAVDLRVGHGTSVGTPVSSAAERGGLFETPFGPLVSDLTCPAREELPATSVVTPTAGTLVTMSRHATTPLTSTGSAAVGTRPVPVPCVSTPMSHVPYAQQLPPLPKFTGDDRSGESETFPEWLEQFEMVSSLACWNDQAKLANLVTRLKGSAYAFYRACTPEQRSSYSLLVPELSKRFVPVRIEAVQSGLFHEQKQKKGETVDDYAQDLRHLYQKAYHHLQKGSEEARTMGKSVLAYQFVSGLLPELKSKVAGTSGDLDHLLTLARFEEAKMKEFGGDKTQKSHGDGGKPKNTPSRPQESKGTPKTSASPNSKSDSVKCFKCGMIGHYQRNCPYARQSKSDEARKKPVSQLTAVNQSDEDIVPQGARVLSPAEKVECLRQQLMEAEREAAVDQVVATTYQVAATHDGLVGPVPTAEVFVNGVMTTALLDTGSPTSILSLSFAIEVLKEELPKFPCLQEWKAAALKQLEPPSVALKSYGGENLNLVGQMQASLSTLSHAVSATVQVQKTAPVDLLLGTDLLTSLGFNLIQSGDDNNRAVQIIQEGVWTKESCDSSSFIESTQSMEDIFPRTHPATDVKQQTTDPETSAVARSTHTVCLLQAVRVPPRHTKLVQMRVQGVKDLPLSLFTAYEEVLQETGVCIGNSVVGIGTGSCIPLLVENRSYEPLHLKKGTPVGSVEPLEGVVTTSDLDESDHVIVDGADSPDSPDADCNVNYLMEQDSPTDRVERLLSMLNLGDSDLTEEQLSRLQTLIRENADVFALDSSELGSTDVITHTIDTGEHPPIKQPLRRMPFALRKKTLEMIEEMLEQNVIQPSTSPWASPVVIVRKKDGGLRFCIDHRRLNSITKMDVFPLPRIDDTLDLLSENKYFSTLDLASGYWQVRMDPDSQEKTAFATTTGLYEFISMPFGLTNAPATFQRLMEIVLKGLARECCMVYLDDILVMGRTFEEHLDNLRKVFARLREAKLTLKPKKCLFIRETVEFLGHLVSADGIAADPRKIEAVREYPVPQDVRSLRSFLGLASYYRRFIPNFSKVAAPLFSLTRQDVPFDWSSDCQEAFEHLKGLLTTSPVLVFPDFSKEFLLETDASASGLGAVLAQRQENNKVQPIAYASRTLQPNEKNYGISELEALGVVWAVKHFRPYLFGHRCVVYTDHQALKSLLNTPQPSGKLARWGMAIQELDLEIVHRSGKANSNADALSRYPSGSEDDSTEPFGIVAANDAIVEAEPSSMAEQQCSDAELAGLITYLMTGILPSDEQEARKMSLISGDYTLRDDVLYHVEKDKTLRLVPPTSLRQKLFEEVHSGTFSGHLREAKIHSELARHYYWPGMWSDITRWARACLTCASRQPGRAVKSPLTPIPVGGAFDRVGVDVIQFPVSKQGNKYAVVFVDYLTKWPEVFAVPDQTAHTVAQLLVEHIISRHGVPSELLSDRGANFLSGLLKEVCTLMGMQRVNTTAYHPQTDGLVERFNRTLTDMLAKTVARSGSDWDERLPYVLFAYRAAAQESTKESPFFLLYGRDRRLPTETAFSPPTERSVISLGEYGVQLVGKFSEAWKTAKDVISRSQHRQKTQYDKQVKVKLPFRVGDRVFLYKPSVKSGKAYKFCRPFAGPYRIVELTSNNAQIRHVDKPQEEPIFVALDRLRRCPEEITDGFWSGKSYTKASKQTAQKPETPLVPPVTDLSGVVDGPWSGRLRPRK